MKRRIVAVIFGVTALALILLAVPLAIDERSRIRNDERSELARLAALAAADISVEAASGHDAIELPPTTDPATDLAVYSAAGVRLVGTGPGRLDASLGRMRAGRVAEVSTRNELVVAVPIAVDEKLTAVVRAAKSMAALQSDTRSSWARIVAVATLALAAATLLALALANRLLRPVRELREMAASIGTGHERPGDGSLGLAEIDAIADALRISAQRVNEGLSRERAFSADASHQLRTPLTGLRLTLEGELEHPRPQPSDALIEALADVDQLEATIEGLLRLARESIHQRSLTDCAPTIIERVEFFRRSRLARARVLTVTAPTGSIMVRAATHAVAEILDVLLTNALLHATGSIAVEVECREASVAINVTDQGPGIANPSDVFHRRHPNAQGDAKGNGIGLALARRLAQTEGGQLSLVENERFCRFQLILPATPD